MSVRMVLVGPPGAGKGTQAEAVTRKFGVPAVSTGAIFRAHTEAGDELGRLADSFTSRGELVPDEVTDRMVEARLDHAVRHFVGHELAAGREGVREPAEFVARLGVGAEDRPRGDGGDAELAGDRLGLGSLARTGGTDEDHSYRH